MRTLVWATLALAVGCSRPEPPSVHEPQPEPELVSLSHTRELRAAWVATVANIDFPSAPGLDAAAQQRELGDLVELFDDLGFNTVVFQVRPEGDALYASELEPWSRFLTGTQGVDPGWDPLAFLVEHAHARGIEVHAWFNPYRARSDRRAASAPPHLSVVSPDLVVPYGAVLWMDPGREEVRRHTVEVVRDVVARYDIDAVHFDDYFYPYPNGTEFPDAATYAAYLAAGGTLDRDDWRRSNVDALVHDVSVAVKATKPWVRFGISPFGIYRPGEPEGIRGMDQVAAIHADPLRWVDEGWVDYLAPQLYWPTTQTAQAYGVLLDWWAERVADRATLYVGNYLSQVGSAPAWSVDELRAQHDLAAAHPGVSGNIWFSAKPLREDREHVQALFREVYDTPALPPVRSGDVPPPPVVEIDSGELCLRHGEVGRLRGFVVYDDEGRVHAITRPGVEEHVGVPPGRYAVTAVDRRGAESGAVPVEVP